MGRGVVDEAVGPGGGGEHRGVLRRIEVEPALRIPFYAQEFAPRVGLRPVEVGTRGNAFGVYRNDSLQAEQEWTHEDEESDEARDRVARQPDERRAADR